MKLGCLLSRDHRKSGLLDLLRVPHPSSAVDSTTPLDFRASGQRFVRCRIGFTCCKEGFEDNLEKLQKAGFPTCKRREARASRQERLRMRMRIRRNL